MEKRDIRRDMTGEGVLSFKLPKKGLKKQCLKI